MSLFRSRAKILGQISRNDITIPRSASTQSEKSRFNNSIPRLCIKNAGETQDVEVQKAQITPSRSLFSLFRKRVPTVQEDVVSTTSQEKNDESWLTKLFAKQPRPLTSQGKSMMESIEIQRKHDVGYIKLPNSEWKPNIDVITGNNYIPQSKLTINSNPPQSLQSLPPPSVETQLKELQKKSNTDIQCIGKEVDMNKYIIKLPYSEFKPQKKEIPEKFNMEKFDDKRSPNLDAIDVRERKRTISTHGHRKIDRKFSWYTQQSIERTEPTFQSVQPNKAFMHTDGKAIQHFSYRNCIQPRGYGKIRGHSIQLQINNRKHVLAQIQNKMPINIFLKDKCKNIHKQIAKELLSSRHAKISKLSTAHFTPESLTCIPKVTKEDRNKTSTKSLKYNNDEILKNMKNDGLKTTLKVRPHHLSKTTGQMFSKSMPPKGEKISPSIQQLNVQKMSRCIHNSPKTKGSVLWDTGSSSKCAYIDSHGITPNEISEITKQTNMHKEVTENEQKLNTNTLNADKKSQSISKFEFRKWIRRVEQREQFQGLDMIDKKILPNSQEMQNKEIFSESKINHLNKDFTTNDVLSEINKTSNYETPKLKLNKKMPEYSGTSKITLSKLNSRNVSNSSVKMPAFQLPSKLQTSDSNSTLNAEQCRKYSWDREIPYAEARVNKNDTQGNRIQKNEKQNTAHVKGLLTSKYIVKNRISAAKTFAINKHSKHFRIHNLKDHKNKYLNMNLETVNYDNKTLGQYKSKAKLKEIDAELRNHSNLSSSNGILSDKNILKYLQNKSNISHNSPKNFNTHMKYEDSLNKLSVSKMDLFQGHLLDKQPKHLPNLQTGKPEVKLCSNLTEHGNSQIQNSEKIPTTFSQECSIEKNPKLNEKSNPLENRNKHQKVDKQKSCIENVLENSLEGEGNAGIDMKENTVQKENIKLQDIKTNSQIGLLAKNCIHNYSLGNDESSKLHLESSKSLVPIEVNVQADRKNSILNKNWTFSDIAACFYGAIFSKQDMLNIDFQNTIGNNNKEWYPVMLDRKPNIHDSEINNLKSEKIISEIENSNKTGELQTKTSFNESESQNESVAKIKFVDETPRKEINTIERNLETQNTEKQIELQNAEEDTENITPTTSGAAKTLLTRNSFATPFQCSKRNYSSWNVQEPFSFGQSSYECKDKCQKKSKPKKKDKCGKKKKSKGKHSKHSTKPTPTNVAHKLECEKKKVEKLKCKRLHMPGCAIPKTIRCCEEENLEKLPCIKKEAPSPSFSECMKYPIVIPKFTECKCLTSVKKCKPAYEAPKNYDACRKKAAKKRPKKKGEEELVDDDEGEFPPC